MGKEVKMLIGGGLITAFFVAAAMLIGWTRIEGNERVVVQHISSGVQENTLSAGTSFYIPLWTNHYKYNVGASKFIMGKAKLYASNAEKNNVDFPAFTITTGGSGKEQPATFSLTMQYHLNPEKLIALHNSAQTGYEELVIKPALTRIISDSATTQNVLNFYSGEGRVKLQKLIEAQITGHPNLQKIGIVIDTFVIDDISLDPDYVNEISRRQLAIQKKLRSIEEAKAAQEDAKRQEKIAEAGKLKRIVAAQASKQEKILAAEARAQQRILNAKAVFTEQKLKAEALRYAKEQDAKGLLVQGQAEAAVAKAKRDAKYAGESGKRLMLVEIEKAKAERVKNLRISGVITEKTILNILDSGTLNEAPKVVIPVTP